MIKISVIKFWNGMVDVGGGGNFFGDGDNDKQHLSQKTATTYINIDFVNE